MVARPRGNVIVGLVGPICFLTLVGSCAKSVRDRDVGVLTYEESWKSDHDKFCDALLNCPAGVVGLGVSNHRAVLRTKDRCIQYQTESLEGSSWHDDLLEGFASGRILFDGSRAAECAALPTTCVTFPRPSKTQTCYGIIAGTIPIGGECNRPFDCEEGSYCQGGSGSCPGFCTPSVPVGDRCERTSECARDEHGYAECDTSVEPSVCVLRALRFDALLGETCGIQPNGERVVCDGRFWCDGPADALGTCRKPIPLGARNERWDAPCEGLAFRDPATETCELTVVGDQPGDPCDGPGLARHMCDPLANLVCVGGSCEMADGTLGSPCNSDGLSGDTCVTGFYCDWDTLACAAVKQADAPCTSNRECEYSCNLTAGTCTDQFCGGFF